MEGRADPKLKALTRKNKNILDGLSMFLQALAVVISLLAGAIILILAGLWEKILKLRV
jgi:hypothetical protein